MGMKSKLEEASKIAGEYNASQNAGEKAIGEWIADELKEDSPTGEKLKTLREDLKDIMLASKIALARIRRA